MRGLKAPGVYRPGAAKPTQDRYRHRLIAPRRTGIRRTNGGGEGQALLEPLGLGASLRINVGRGKRQLVAIRGAKAGTQLKLVGILSFTPP